MAAMPAVQSEAKKTVDLWVDIGSDPTTIAVARERLVLNLEESAMRGGLTPSP
jgi:hypothetical protein